jgi:hypothetical protein
MRCGLAVATPGCCWLSWIVASPTRSPPFPRRARPLEAPETRDGREGINARLGDTRQAGTCRQRGALLTAPLSGHQVMINGHPPCHRSPSFVAVIPVGPEPRSRWNARDEAETNDLDVGGQKNCLETAPAITECDRAKS